MSAKTGIKLIESRFDDNWSDTLLTIWPNTVKEAPTDGDTGYVVVTISENDANPVDVTPLNRRHRHSGLAIFSLFHPLGKGLGGAMTHADNIAGYFRDNSDTEGTTKVTYRSPNIRRVGSDGQHYQIDIEVPFVRDTT